MTPMNTDLLKHIPTTHQPSTEVERAAARVLKSQRKEAFRILWDALSAIASPVGQIFRERSKAINSEG